METRDARLAQETQWYKKTRTQRHILNRWPFWSELRNHLSYEIARYNLAFRVQKLIPACESMLIAPCGLGSDLLPFAGIWPGVRVAGIDISPEAVEQSQIRDAQVGDILKMPFANASFDVVICALFFHHVVDEGYDSYLQEIRRVLKPGGALITLEPSRFHPISLVTRPLRRIFGNITGQVEHEHPISIRKLIASLHKSGFIRTTSFACSFGHNRIPTPLTCILNVLRFVPSLTPLAWQVGIVAWID